MCLAVILWQVRPDEPLVIAANRDEMYARRAAPARRLDDPPGVIAGLDLEGKPMPGTWLGAHPDGFFVLVTNHFTGEPPQANKRSRGDLVMDVLRTRALPAGFDARDYNPFNLLFGDARGLRLVYGRDPAGAEILEVPPGFHALPSGELDSPRFPKVARIRELLEPHVRAPWADLAPRLERALGDHLHPGLDAVCIHTTVYGTRSSTILRVTTAGLADYRFADGPPCVTPFTSVID